MTREVITVDPDTPLQQVANLPEDHGIKRVPVVEDGRLVGIVSRANLVQVLASGGVAFVDPAEADEALRKVIMLNLRKLPWSNCNGGRDCSSWCSSTSGDWFTMKRRRTQSVSLPSVPLASTQ
jgi:hypothetical protein